MNKPVFKLKDSTIEIGDSKQESFYTQLKIKKFDNQTNFSIRYSDIPDSVTHNGNITVTIHGNISSKIYPITIDSVLNGIRWIHYDSAIDPETASAQHEYFIKNFRSINNDTLSDSKLIISSYRINKETIILNDFDFLEKHLVIPIDIPIIRMITGSNLPIYINQGMVIYTIYYGTNIFDTSVVTNSIKSVALEYGLNVIMNDKKMYFTTKNGNIKFHEYFISEGILIGFFNINCVDRLNDYLINPIEELSGGLIGVFNTLNYDNYLVLVNKFINNISIALSLEITNEFYNAESLQKIEDIKLLQSYLDWIPYAIRPDPDFYYWTPQDSLEFEMILQEAPIENLVNFTLQFKELTFTVQETLTLQERLNGITRLPHIEKSIVGYYGTNKVIHIYRPWVVDSNGVKQFCEHYIINDIYTIVLPEGISYPVVLDPTLGYSTIGGTLTNAITSASNSYIFATRVSNTTLYNTPAIFFYQSQAVTTTSSQCAIYKTGIDNKITNGILSTTNAGSVITGTAGFVGNAFTNPVTLYPGTDYIIAFTDTGVAGGTKFAYDSSTGSVSYTIAQSYAADTFPTSINNSWTIQRDIVYSVYAFTGYSFPVMGVNTNTMNNAADYSLISNIGLWTGTTNATQICPGNSSYVFSNFSYNLTTAPGVGNSRTVSLIINSNSNLSLTISDTSTRNSNNINASLITNGQVMQSFKSETGTPTDTTDNNFYSVQTGIGQLLFIAVSIDNAATNYTGLSSINAESSLTTKQYIPDTGTLRNFIMSDWKNVITGGTYTLTLYKGNLNGAASSTGIVFVLDSATHSASDTSTTVSVIEGDYFYWEMVPSALTVSGTCRISGGCEYFSSTLGNGVLLGGSASNISNSGVNYGYWGRTDTTNSNERSALSSLIVIKKMFAIFTAAPGTGKSRNVTFRKNSTNTPVTLTVSDSDTYGTWTELPQTPIIIDKNNLINIATTPSGTPTSAMIGYSVLFSSFLPTINNHRYDYSLETITEMLELETLTSSGAISTTIPTTEIIDYTLTGVYTLDIGSVYGFIKTIYIQNILMRVQINLPKGSFILDSSVPSVTLEWDSTLDTALNGNWRIIKNVTIPVFPSRQQGTKLIGTGFSGDSGQGNSVALSGDGNTLIIGGRTNDNLGTNIGATWVFTRSGTIWSQQGPRLIGTGFSGFSTQQGVSCSISKNGDTFAVGGFGDNSASVFIGAVWVFTRSGTIWTQQGVKLVGTGFSGSPQQGTKIALSSDGNTLAVGGPWEDSSGGDVGSTYIFTRSGTVWSQQGSKLIGTGFTGASGQGASVALSSDGNTLAVGALRDDGAGTDTGATWMFTRSGTIWTQQGSKLIGTGFTGDSGQGGNVALSSDGNTLAIGGYTDDSSGTNVGATWMFTRSGTIWTQQGIKLIGTGFTGDSRQGSYLALSSDGNTLAIGGYLDDGAGSNVGASWIFTRSGTIWTQQGTKLIGTGFTGDSQQGFSGSLSVNGDTLAVGGYQDDGSATNVGATWIFI